MVEQEIKPRFDPTNKAVGIDLGLTHFLTKSNNEKIENPRWLRENQMKLSKAQRQLAKKKKGSNRFEKCKIRIAKIHKDIVNQRKWHHHQI